MGVGTSVLFWHVAPKPGVARPKIMVGVLQIVTLFNTEIRHFLYPFPDLVFKRHIQKAYQHTYINFVYTQTYRVATYIKYQEKSYTNQLHEQMK